MNKVLFLDNGDTLEYEDNKDLVTQMRKGAEHVYSRSNLEYMKGFATRAVVSRNIDIRATDEDSFIEDLLANGYLERLSDGDCT